MLPEGVRNPLNLTPTGCVGLVFCFVLFVGWNSFSLGPWQAAQFSVTSKHYFCSFVNSSGNLKVPAQVSPFHLQVTGFHPSGQGSSLTHTEKPGLFEDSLERLPTAWILRISTGWESQVSSLLSVWGVLLSLYLLDSGKFYGTGVWRSKWEMPYLS